jgi:serine-type D-Ala-D-Ala carboxypeptidase/endopeptidase (penicillin-binding protein 4)
MVGSRRVGHLSTVTSRRRPRRARRLALPAAILALTAPGALAAPAPQTGANRLQAAMAAYGRAHPSTTALVWRLGPAGPTPIVAFKPDIPRMPASTMKLVTGAGALLTLGPGFRFETRLVAGRHTRRVGRVLKGPVYLKGYGDPVLSTPLYARRFLNGRGGNLGKLAGQLRGEGVSLLRGPIVADETFFDGRRTGNSWKAGYSSECPPLSGLAVNQDYAGEWRSGLVANPPVAAAQRLRGVMGAVGVRQVGRLQAGRAPAHGRVLATVSSPPLRAILGVMLPESDNFIAETLAKDVGAYAHGEGTTQAGTLETSRLLSSRGILGPTDRLVDGSGLSRENRLAATSLVRLLAAATQEPAWGDALIRAMAQGGEGTLKHRFLNSSGVRVRAKTGYIDGVAGLAGIATSPSGTKYAFAFLMNDWDIGGAHAIQDRIVGALAQGAGDRVPALPA